MNNENRDIFLIGDFNYDTYKSSIYQRNNVNSESFTNTLAGFNMYKLIYKLTRIKPPCATLLDNNYTNIQITIDSSKSGILISDHFFVFGIFDDMRINPTHHAFKKRCFTEKNIAKFSNILYNKNWWSLYINNYAQKSFTAFYSFFLENFENIFPEKFLIKIN